MAEMVKIHGMDALRANLRLLGRDTFTQPEVATALRAGGNLVKKEAVQKAPMASSPHRVGKKGNKVDPGFLRKNIRVARTKKTNHYVSLIVGVRSKAFYWRFLEFGTRFIRARPFLRPAFEQNKQQTLDAIIERLKARLDLQVRRFQKAAR